MTASNLKTFEPAASFNDGDLAANLRIYNWVRVLQPRVFIPLTAVYWVQIGHLDLRQLGSLAVVAAIMGLIGNIPSGHYADRHTRRAALIIGALLAAMSTIATVVLPSYPGAILATSLDALGYAFMSGAGQALIHDSLHARAQTSQYVRIMGRAQSFAMTGNVVLVGIIPLSYGLDPRLPFLCGAIAYLALIATILRLHEPPRPQLNAGMVLATTPVRRLIQSLRQFVNRRSIAFFIALGLISALYSAPISFINIAQVDLGLPANLMGLLYAAGSVVAALGGWYLHYLRKLSLSAYALLDILMLVLQPLVIGLTRNLWLSMAAFAIVMGFWRFRNIVYQDHILRHFDRHHDKATLISVMGFFSDAQLLWLPLWFAHIMAGSGTLTGLTQIAVGIFVVMPAVMLGAIVRWEQRPRSSKAFGTETVAPTGTPG